MDENVFEIGGKIYVSACDEKGVCIGCSLDMGNECGLDDMDGIPSCTSAFRVDGRERIFVEKQQ